MSQKKYFNLKQFLQRHKTIPEKTFTHTSLGEPPKSYPGSYCIEPTDEEDFYDYYTNYVFSKGGEAHLTERHKEVSPILIDLDFRHDNTNMNRRYTKNFKEIFLKEYIKIVCDLVDVAEEDRVAFVLEKDKPVLPHGKSVLKDGIHIIFPFIITNPKLQYIFRYKSIMNDTIIELFNSIDVTNTPEDIFDIAVIEKNNWQMYGSCKPSNLTYKLTDIVKLTGEHQNYSINYLENNYSDKELVKLLSIRDIQSDKIVSMDEIADRIEEAYTLLPKKQQVKKRRQIRKRKSPLVKNRVDDDEDLVFIKSVVKILNNKRTDSYSDWIRLGWCLHNIDYRLLEDWVEFSKKSEKFVAGECEKEWDNMKNEGLGIGSLYLWAKDDDLLKFTELSRDNLRKCMIDSLSIAPNDIAKVVKHMYKNEFVCCSSKRNIWYQFKNHRWREIDNAVELRKRLSHDLVDEYLKLNMYISKKAYEIDMEINNKDKQHYMENLKIIQKIIDKLKNTSFKKNVIVECSELFHDSKFEQRLDKKLSLIGFENGVYDLDMLQFRDGVFEDYISLSSGINYYDHEEDDENLLAVIKFLEEVLPKRNIREYVLKLMSTFLHGAVKQEKFHIWTGCHAKGSGIMNSDGDIVAVEDIKPGDRLMGPDSKPREVLELVNGSSTMYKIQPCKGDSFVVNDDHILALKATELMSIYNNNNESRVKLTWQETDFNGFPINKCKNFPYKSTIKKLYRQGVMYYDNHEQAIEVAEEYKEYLLAQELTIKKDDIIEIPLSEYLKRKNKIGVRNYYLYKVPLEFEHNEVILEPYTLGLWLGSGINDFDELNTTNFLEELEKCGITSNKYIPKQYLHNSTFIRMEVLGGLLDSFGYYNKEFNQYEFNIKSNILASDILYLVRSLGFASTKKTRKINNIESYQVVFYGDNLDKIPVKKDKNFSRVRAINKHPLKFSFKVTEHGVDDYYGFKLDNDHLYVAEDFIVHHNCGGNGKSKLIDLFQNCFRDYCCPLSTSQITKERGRAEGANSALARTKNKRFVVLQEPESNEEIKVGEMKMLTGGDTVPVRELYKEQEYIKPQFKMVLTCNALPSLSSSDRGVWRRVSVVEFISVFTDKPDPNEKYQFMIDEGLNEKICSDGPWVEPFIYLLIEYYQKYLKSGLTEPSDVRKYTEEYQSDSDFFIQFINERIVELDNCDTKPLKIDSIYAVYQEWFRQTKGQNVKCPSRKELKTNLNKKFGAKCSPNNKNIWIGLALKDTDEDE